MLFLTELPFFAEGRCNLTYKARYALGPANINSSALAGVVILETYAEIIPDLVELP